MFRWLFLLIPCLLMAFEGEEGEETAKVVSDLSDFNSDPSAMVHSVNVITGQFVDWNVDMTVMGPVPLTWERSCGHERRRYSWADNWWRAGTNKIIKKVGESDQSSIEIEGAHGREFIFEEKYKKKSAPHIIKMGPDRYEYGVTNTPGKKSGMRHLRNVVLEENRPYMTLKEGDGTRTIFRKGEGNELIFEKEVRPDGNYITIEGNRWNRTLTSHDRKGKPLNHITLSDPLEREWPETPGYMPMVTLRSDNGHAVEYRYIKHYFITPNSKEVYSNWVLHTVTRTSGPSIHYQYENYGDCHHGYLAQINHPEGRYLRIERYLKGYPNYVGDKKKVEVDDYQSFRAENVRILYAPSGVDGAAVPIYQFYYHTSSKRKNREEGKATVWNARGQKRIYRHKRLRLTDIETYEHGNLYCKERFEWGKHNSQSDCDLQRRWVEDAEGVTCLEKNFTYDEHHNVIAEEISGNITGLGTWDTATKHFQYSQEGMNLLVRQEEEGKVTLITHIPETNLIASKIEREKGGLTRREFYRYNDAAVKTEEIFDDGYGDDRDDLRGVTQRLIRFITVSDQGMPVNVAEYYQEGESTLHLLRREENEYTHQGRLIRQLQFDANDRVVTTLEWNYDSHGNITRFTDPEGFSTFRRYDANDNLIYEKKEVDDYFKEWHYDLMNRMIAEIEVHPDRTYSSHFSYDIAGNKTSETDWYGNTTRYGSDFRDRIFETVSPVVRSGEGATEVIVRKKYDLLGRVSEIQDPNDNLTRYENTIYGKPCKVSYPDGSQERFEYDLSGRLVAKIDPKGRRKEFTYDGFGRLLTETENGLTIKTRVYNAYHLLSETDAGGFTVYYEYDGAGRKVAEQAGCKRVEYEYDPQGRVIRTKSLSQIAEVDFNLRDQPVEERLWDNEGNLLSRIGYVYDAAGRKTHSLTYTESGVQVDETRYNSRGDVIWHKNVSGEVTETYYDFDHINERGQYVPKEIRVDPLGQKMVTIMDPVGRAVHVELISSFGHLLQLRDYEYDLIGKRIASKESVVSEGQVIRTVLNRWEYDKMSRLIKVTEGAQTVEQKVTSYSYNTTGKKQRVDKPDGKAIYFIYDDFDRVIEIAGSDIHYAYSYDLQGNPIRVRDRVNKTTTLRTYSPERYLMSEKLGNGVQLQFDRDEEGKVTAVSIKGVGSIRYFYKGPRLHYIERWDEAGQRLYTASYDAYNLTGNVTAMTLPHNTPVKIAYDEAGRIDRIESPLWEQSEVKYDSLGNVIHDALKEGNYGYERDYAYDGLSQLTEERGFFSHTFKHDSLCNLVEEDGAAYDYNALNQPLNRDEDYDRNGNLIREGGRVYVYDSLDRLIRVEEGGEVECYTYDELHRRLTAGAEKFIYLGADEVGSIEEGVLRSLRVLGKGVAAEIGASMALEIEGEVFAPVHDRSGHITALYDKEGEVAQTLRYSAFGDYEASGRVASPWLFSSKRWDGKAKLFYFGRRYYNPRSHRWTTADPIKFDGGANLYAYVENNPLTLLDPYGLSPFGMNESPLAVYDYVFSFVSCVTQFVGKTVEAVGAHLVPIPLVRDVIECAGYVMQGNDIKDYKMSYSRDHSCTGTFQGTNPKNSNKVLLTINGICTSYAEYMEQVAQFSADHGGADVEYVYNGTNGVICDLLECSMQKIGIPTRPERMLHEKVKSIIDERGGVESDVQILMRAHSQGGLIAGNMVNYLSHDYTTKIHLRTMGSASVVSNRGFGSVINYVAAADYVPLTDPIGYLSAMFLKDRTMLISEPSRFHIMEHCLVDESYQEASDRINKEFNKFLQG